MPTASPVAELQKRDLTAREIVIRADSIDIDGRSFEAIVATETRSPVLDMRAFEIIDEVLIARGGEFPDSIPLLDDHNRSSVTNVMGRAENFRMSRGQWTGRAVVANPVTDDDPVRIFWGRLVDRAVRAVSIGYQYRDFVDIPPGGSKRVAGRQFTAGERRLRIATEWVARELSVTPVGADSAALIRTEPTIPKRRSLFR